MEEDELKSKQEQRKVDEKRNKEEIIRQKKQAEKSAEEIFELVRLRNNFYRDSYRRLIVLLLLMGGIIIILCGIIYYMYVNRPEPKYFATNIQGQLIKIDPLNVKGNITDGEVLNWAARGISSAFTINYVEWRQQLQYVQDTYFTTSGSEAYLKALEDAQTLDTIRGNKLIATAQATAAPIIEETPDSLKDKSYKGPYYWVIKMPITMTLQNPETIFRLNMEIRMRVVRSSRFIDDKAVNIDGARGIGIDVFLAKSIHRGTTSKNT